MKEPNIWQCEHVTMVQMKKAQNFTSSVLKGYCLQRSGADNLSELMCLKV